MTKRNYSNVAPPLPLGVAVNNAATAITVTSTTGYPAAPFLLSVERGTASEEVMLCTAKTSTVFTVTRGYDGTTATAHAIGSMVEHTVAAIDYRESTNTPMTTAERDALSGVDLWDGRFITNTDSDTLERYDLGTTTWVLMARMADVSAAVTAGITGKADKATVLTAGNGLTGGGDLSAGRTFTVNFTASGGANGTATTVPRSDDARFSDARTPVTHAHAQTDVTGLTTALGLLAPSASPTFSGTITTGTADADVELIRALLVDVDSRNLTLTYTSGDLTGIVEKNGATTVSTTTIAYSSGNISTVTVVAGGKTSVTTMGYTGTDLTSTTRSVT